MVRRSSWAEGRDAVTTVPVPPAELTVGRQGHYAGAVSRLAAFAADVGASWGLYTLAVVLLGYAAKLLTGHSFTLTNHRGAASVVLLIWSSSTSPTNGRSGARRWAWRSSASRW